MTHRERMDAFWKAFEAGEIDRVIAEMVTPDIEFTMPGTPPLHGAAQARRLWTAWREAFPDMRHETAHAIEADDTYSAETRFSGTHTGMLRGAQGEIPATGKTVRWESADVVRFERGRIKSWHVYHDQMALLGQLGLMR